MGNSMKLTLLTASLLLFVVAATAQPAVHWQHIYGDTLSQSGTAGMFRLPSGDLIIAGDINHQTPLLLDQHLTRISTDGDSVYMRSLDLENTQHTYACILGQDGNIAVAGSYSYEENENYYTNSSLNIYDQDGNLLYTYGDGADWVSEAFALTATIDAGYLIAGFVQDEGGVDPERDLWLVRLDATANFVWGYDYDVDARDEPRAVVALPDGSFLIAGNTRTGDAPLRWRPFLLHIDADGNELNRRVLPMLSVDQFVYDLHFTPQRRLYIAGESYVEGQPSQQTDGFLTLLDMEFNPIATEYYGGTSYDGFRAIEPLPNGDLLLVGHAQSFSGNFVDDMYVVRVNPIGGQRWFASLGDAGVDKGYAIIPVETERETQYIVTGTSSPAQQSWNKNVISVRFSARAPLYDIELISAEEDTIEIPAEGGNFSFDAILSNNTPFARTYEAWVAVAGPAGQLSQPLRLANVLLQAQNTQTYPILQPFPTEYPPGIYHYIGRLGNYPNHVIVADTLILRKADPE
jgi:hypothetical protein